MAWSNSNTINMYKVGLHVFIGDRLKLKLGFIFCFQSPTVLSDNRSESKY